MEDDELKQKQQKEAEKTEEKKVLTEGKKQLITSLIE